MHSKRFSISLINCGVFLLFISILWISSAKTASAQCGTQASTCKDCHEVQGQLAVNSDGTGWHQSHAFGDFCYICHAGNNTATDKVAAHEGMVAPLSDVKAACQQCHPKDLVERAQVYASALGVPIGGLETSQPTASPASTGSASASAAPVEMCPTPGDKSVILAQPATSVDYVALYNRNVLGIRRPDWGKIVLFGLAPILLLAALWAFASRKGWLKVSFMDPDAAPAIQREITDSGLLPLLDRMDPAERRNLKRFLEDAPAAKQHLASYSEAEDNTSAE